MYNPITFIKDVIDLVRNPAGEAVGAMEITEANEHLVEMYFTPDTFDRKYLVRGDFLLMFEREDFATICPRKEFFKHYEFIHEPYPDRHLTPVRTIKPL